MLTVLSRARVRVLPRLTLQAQITLAIFGIALVMRLAPLGGYSTEYDEGVYWQSLRAMAGGHALFNSVFSSQPPFFLLSVYPFYIAFGQTLVAARAAMLVYSMIGIGAAYLLGKALCGRWAANISALLLALDPLYLQQSHTLEAEMPSLALQLVCVALTVEGARRRPRTRHWLALGAGVALGLATMAKLFAVVAVVPAALYLLAPAVRAALTARKHGTPRSRRELLFSILPVLPDLGILAGSALGTVAVVILPFVGSFAAMYNQTVTFHLIAEQTQNRGLGTNLQVLVTSGGEYPLVIVALVATVVLARQRAWRIAPLVLWVLASLALLLKQQPLFAHHVVLIVPPLALLAGQLVPEVRRIAAGVPVTAAALRHRASRARSYAAGALLGAAVLVCAVLDIPALLTASAPLPASAAREVIALDLGSGPNQLVVSDDQYIAALADRSVPPQLVDTSLVRIESGNLTAAQLESVISSTQPAAILFASGRFAQVPGFRAWVVAHYSQQFHLANGSVLYMNVPRGAVIA